jgi:hypothetical protein
VECDAFHVAEPINRELHAPAVVRRKSRREEFEWLFVSMSLAGLACFGTIIPRNPTFYADDLFEAGDERSGL